MTRRAYTPSNSDDGLAFEGRWCDKCERDRGYREDRSMPELGCVTLANAYAGDFSCWHYDENGVPVCSEFVAEGEALPVEVHEGQETLL